MSKIPILILFLLISSSCEDKRKVFRQAITQMNTSVNSDLGSLRRGLVEFQSYLGAYEPWAEGQFLGTRGTSLTVNYINCLDKFKESLVDQDKIRSRHLELLSSARNLDSPLTRVSAGDTTELRQKLQRDIDAAHQSLKEKIAISLAQKSECHSHYRKLDDFIASSN